MDTVIGALILLPIVVALTFWRTLLSAGVALFKGRREVGPQTMPSWAIGAFGLGPGERPVARWAVQVSGGEPAWAAVTTASVLALGTGDGTNIARIAPADLLGHEVVPMGPGRVVTFTVTTTTGGAQQFVIEADGAKQITRWLAAEGAVATD